MAGSTYLLTVLGGTRSYKAERMRPMPALDPNKLPRNELGQLVNSTPLGECTTRSRLDRQMNRAGRRWDDGRNIRLLDYLRWLAREVDRPAKPKHDSRPA